MARKTAAPNAKEERQSSRKIGVLAALWPFMRPYKALMFVATCALVLTAGVSLSLPLAEETVTISWRPRKGSKV